jgi:hypothetical protein
MSNPNHKRSASPTGDRDASLNKRQKRDQEEKKQAEVDGKENQLDEKEEKKELEINPTGNPKEDVNAAALSVSDSDLVVGTVDRDLICTICFSLLSKPKGLWVVSLFSSTLHCSCFSSQVSTVAMFSVKFVSPN